MSDRISNNGSGPVGGGEHRDADLAETFAGDPVPAHGADFWSNLQAEMAEAGPHLRPAGLPEDTTAPFPTLAAAEGRADATTDRNDRGDDREDGRGDGRGDGDETMLVDVVPLNERRRSFVPMAMAAASIAVVGLGIAALLSANSGQDSIDSAEVSTEPPVSVADEVTPTSEVPEPETTVDETAQLDEDDETPASFPIDDGTVTSIGPGSVVGFSPDQASVLMVDTAINPESGCEGADRLDLYAQSLASGERRRLLPEGMAVETGGLELKITGDRSLPAGQQTVVFTDYCDGVRSSLWSGQIAADGSITGLVELEIDSPNDPFATSGVPAEVLSANALTADGSLGLYVEDGEAFVRPLDSAAPDPDWRLGGVSVTGGSSFDPNGQTVAVAGQDVFHLWNFRTGQLASYPLTGSFDTLFAESGQMVAIQTLDSNPEVSLVTFGEAPTPVAAVLPTASDPTGSEPTDCSVDSSVAPLSADDLVAQGLSQMVADKVVAIDQAAAICDWQGLDGLGGSDFTGSFGGNTGDFWQQNENNSGDANVLRLVLRQPVGEIENEPLIYVWPEVNTRESCEAFTDRDRQSLAELGYDEAQIVNDCEVFDGYGGYRLGVDAAGAWLYFVTGD